MTTRELVAYIKRKFPQEPEVGICALIDQVQKLVMSKTTEQRTVIDETTGMPPFLVTTDGVYTYNCPANCQRTLQVFAEDIKSYSRVLYDGSIASYEYRGASYYGLPIKSTDAVYGVLAKLTFVGFNPGTTTNKYYHLYAFKAPDITSVSVNLSIPEQFHLSIVDGVLARVRSERFGDNTEWQYWTKRTMLDIVSELNQGAQSSMGETKTRPEYRHYADPVRGQRIR